MCGIAGYVGRAKLEESRIADTLRVMRHRGPDHQATVHRVRPDGYHVHLLHSRLNIIDLDARSHQPFERDGLALVYNGEIYNYPEVKDELTRSGATFHTTSDTEVLAAALRRWGAHDALDRLEGMWAFAAYDERDASLLLSRDRFGEKPLYVVEIGDALYFGSEIKFLSALSGQRLRVNVRHVQRYLVNGYKSLYKSKDTFFEGVRELDAASTMVVRASSSPQTSKYWSPTFQQDVRMTFGEAVHQTRERLLDAVRIRLRADVPLAFCMSGGIDSNTLISIAKNVFGYDVHGFTIVNRDVRYEESELVNLAVREQKLKHTTITPTAPNGLSDLRTLVRHHDAPIYTISYFVHWLLMKAVHDQGYRVSISGTAADELFTGYYDHHLAFLQATRDRAEATLYEEAWKQHVAPWVRNPFLSDPQYFVKDPSRREHIYLDAHVFREFLTHTFDEPFHETEYTGDLLRNRMANELFAEAVPVILHEDDLNAMYHSIENRSPFLDRRLFEMTTRIPTHLLMRDGMAKAVLREAMRDVVPGPILDSRRKVGFNAPIADVFDIGAAEVQQALLAPSPVFEIVKREAIADLVRARDLPNSRSKFLFYFVCTKLFLEEFTG